MERITLGLDIGRRSIKGLRAHGLRAGGLGKPIRIRPGDYFEKVVEREGGSDPFLPLSEAQLGALKALVREGKIKPSDAVAVALPGHLILIKEMVLPFTDPRQIRKTIYYEAENQLPLNIEDVTLDYYLLSEERQKTRLLIFAAPKVVIRQYLEALQSAGIDPVSVSVDTVALAHACLWKRNPIVPRDSGGLLAIDLGATRTLLCGLRRSRLDWVRTIPIGTDFFTELLKEALDLSWKEAEHLLTTLHQPGTLPEKASSVLAQGLTPWLTEIEVSLTKADPTLSSVLYLCGGARLHLKSLLSKALHRPVVVHDPFYTASLEIKSCFVQALGLTLLSEEAIHLRQEEFAHPKEKPRGNRLVSVGLMILLVFGLLADFTLHRLQKEKEFDRLKMELRASFSATFPEAPPGANEVKQTKGEIAALQKQFHFLGVGSDSPLLLLKRITDAIPNEVKLYVADFFAEGKIIQMEAETLSFDAVDQIRSALLQVPSFQEVTVSDAKVSASSGRISFRIRIFLPKEAAGFPEESGPQAGLRARGLQLR